MIPSNWQLKLYGKDMANWCGWFDDENGNCVGFLARDGSLLTFNSNLGEVIRIN